MNIQLYINYSKHNSGVRAYETYALHVYINNIPTWTTYISKEDYDTLEKAGISKI